MLASVGSTPQQATTHGVAPSMPTLAAHTPSMPATVAHVDAATVPITPGSSSVPATLGSSSVQQGVDLPLVLGTKDRRDGKIWIDPRSKHDFVPEDGPSREISRILKGEYDDCWPTWTAISDEYRDMWFESFQNIYKWSPFHSKEVKSIFEHKGSNLLKNIMNKLRSGKDKGSDLVLK